MRYEELTFPEVAELPRNVPLVVPLGVVDLEPEELPLPTVPFGWDGWSRVEAFEPLLQSILACLREDGFTDVRVRRGSPLMERAPVPDGRMALLPVGHTEQHGYHLPLSTDTLIADALADRVVALRSETVCRFPVWPYGVSTHRREFAGTLSCDARLWEDFWVQILDRLVQAGFRTAYLLNGHGGNHSFLVNVTKFAGERHPDCFVATSFLHTSSGRAAELLHSLRSSSLMGHACELETSYLLALRPELVHLERAVDEVEFISTPNYWMDWIEGGALIANPPWTDDTRTGTYGAPSCASAEKGRVWFEAAAEELAGLTDEILEQHRRRRAQRPVPDSQNGSHSVSPKR